MAVLSWWSDCLVDSVNERDLNLLTSRAVSERRESGVGSGVCRVGSVPSHSPLRWRLQEVEVEGIVVKLDPFGVVRVQQVLEDGPGLAAGEEQVPVRCVLEVVPRGDRRAFYTDVRNQAEHFTQVSHVAVTEDGGVGAYAVATVQRETDTLHVQTHPTPVSYTHLTLPTNREV